MALGAAYAAYEAKFGHAFVICLDGVPAGESLDRVLAAIRSRLTNDPDDERIVAAEELRRLARERLVRYLRGAGRYLSAGRRGARPAPTHPHSADSGTALPGSRPR